MESTTSNQTVSNDHQETGAKPSRFDAILFKVLDSERSVNALDQALYAAESRVPQESSSLFATAPTDAELVEVDLDEESLIMELAARMVKNGFKP